MRHCAIGSLVRYCYSSRKFTNNSGRLSQCHSTGHAVPPYVIFIAKQLNILWMKEVASSRYAVSDNGYIDQPFHFWMTDHFMTHAASSRPLLDFVGHVPQTSNNTCSSESGSSATCSSGIIQVCPLHCR